VLVGINLLREGLDLPEVSLVAIIDADKEGFLRSERSLMQTAGRAARNAAGKVIFYADHITESMRKVIAETNRRRQTQTEYNHLHNIEPRTIRKSVEEILIQTSAVEGRTTKKVVQAAGRDMLTEWEREELIERLTAEMGSAAEKLDFERAARIRDEIYLLKGKPDSIRVNQ
jgi:excinuclease ABC subunit B